jgi:hypothetical protein
MLHSASSVLIEELAVKVQRVDKCKYRTGRTVHEEKKIREIRRNLELFVQTRERFDELSPVN